MASDKAMIFVYVLAPEAEVNAADQDGRTAMMWAAGRGNLICLQLLIVSGADVEAVDQNGVTIMRAAQGGHLTCLKLLVASGADVNAASDNGRTALMAAAQGGHLTCLQYLIGRSTRRLRMVGQLL